MTKSTIFIALFFFTFLNQSNCQIEIGLKGGFTNSWPGYGDLELPDDAQTNVSGYNLSIFISRSTNNNLGFSFQPAFIKRGAACFPGWQPVFEGDSKVFLNYFELPIFINKKFKFRSTSIVTSFGYGLSFLNSASVHQEQLFESGTRTVVSNIEVGNDSQDSFNRLDHGFYISIRFDRQIQQNHFIFLESTYYLGMKDYDKVNTSKNRNLNFNIGFGYNI